MKTSRISRETARIVNALATSPRKTRSSARNALAFDSYLHSPNKSRGAEKEAQDIKEEDSDSELSDALSSVSEGYSPPALSSRKRKRGKATPTTSFTTSSEHTTTEISTSKPNGLPKKPRRQPVKKTRTSSGDVKIEAPANWEEVYNLTKEQRSKLPAPVDTMGCAFLADRNAAPRDQRFQTLVSLMLSSQTKDTVTAVAIWGLQTDLPGGLTLESILAVSPTALNQMISKVGFHNTKTKHIKQAAEILRDKFNSDIPDTIEGLVSLPGVGPKMAYLCMSVAWGRDEGIGVDVHVHRITNLWGWHKTSQPEETRKILQSWLPKEKWHDINHLLVGFGQTICTPVGRKSGECVLAEKGLCPGAVIKKETKKKVTKIEVKEEVDMEDMF